MTKKKKKVSSTKNRKQSMKKKCSGKCDKKSTSESSQSQCAAGKALDKVFKKPCTLSYDKNGEVYPKLFFQKDCWWSRLKRFLGFSS